MRAVACLLDYMPRNLLTTFLYPATNPESEHISHTMTSPRVVMNSLSLGIKAARPVQQDVTLLLECGVRRQRLQTFSKSKQPVCRGEEGYRGMSLRLAKSRLRRDDAPEK